MFIRVSYMHPKEGNQERLQDVLRKLSDFYRDQPGYIDGYILSPYEAAADDVSRFGRVGIWESEDAAEAAAQDSHCMALRAQITRLVEEDTHSEFSFEGVADRG